jgi:hypothetical protein
MTTLPGPRPEDVARARQARLVAVVLGATMVLWMAAQWLGRQMGWEARFAFLFDMMAMAAFVWSLIVTMRLWRKRRE